MRGQKHSLRPCLARLAVGAGIAALVAGPATASLLVSEFFQYLPGQPLPTMAGGTGWAAGPWTGSGAMVDSPPTLSYPTALPSSGDALLNMSAGEAFRTFFAPQSNVPSDLWISFQEETSGAPGSAFVDLQPLGSSPDLNVNKDSLGQIYVNGLTIATLVSNGPGKVDFFVLQLHWDGVNSFVNLYLNPPPGPMLKPSFSLPPIPAPFLVNQFYYRSDPGQILDEIRVGTTVLDVLRDTDGDSLPDAGDNCPFTPNGPLLGTCLGDFPQGQALCHANSDCTSGMCSLNQEDTGGIGTGSPPDGIGDACQCGDADNNGIVNSTDATLIKRAVAGIAPYPGGVTTLPGYHKCQVVNGAPGLTCNNTQATIILRAIAGLAPGILQGCHAATIFP